MSRAYAFINERPTTYATLRAEAVSSGRAATKFDVVNIHIRNSVVMPGQLVIVGDDSSKSCTALEAELMRTAQGVRESLVGISTEASEFMVQNYDLAKSMLTYGSIGIGSATGAWKLHLDSVQQTLHEVDMLHKQYLNSNGAGARELFIRKRQIAFQKLDIQLAGLAKLGTGLSHSKSIKSMLGISTKSFLHSGSIRRYTDKLEKIARVSGYLAKGTYVGIGLDVSATALSIVEACSEGREEECRRAQYIETGKLIGGVSVAVSLGSRTSRVAVGLCRMRMPGPSRLKAPVLIGCALLGGVAGSYAGGLTGSATGEAITDVIYHKYN